MPALRMSHESDSASRHRNMLKSLRVDIPHVGPLLSAIGFVRQPPLGRLCERRTAVMASPVRPTGRPRSALVRCTGRSRRFE
jgi:hypothetical protein